MAQQVKVLAAPGDQSSSFTDHMKVEGLNRLQDTLLTSHTCLGIHMLEHTTIKNTNYKVGTGMFFPASASIFKNQNSLRGHTSWHTTFHTYKTSHSVPTKSQSGSCGRGR